MRNSGKPAGVPLGQLFEQSAITKLKGWTKFQRGMFLAWCGMMSALVCWGAFSTSCAMFGEDWIRLENREQKILTQWTEKVHEASSRPSNGAYWTLSFNTPPVVTYQILELMPITNTIVDGNKASKLLVKGDLAATGWLVAFGWKAFPQTHGISMPVYQVCRFHPLWSYLVAIFAGGVFILILQIIGTAKWKGQI